MTTPTHIIADFTRLYRRPAQRMRLNLLDDAEFWTFLKVQFEAGILAAGIEPDSLPFPNFHDVITFGPRVERGKWIAQCVACDSFSVIRRHAQTHVCYSCWNGGTPVWLPISWPENTEEIEAILLRRPNVINRNWYPGETVEMLRQENLDNGVPA